MTPCVISADEGERPRLLHALDLLDSPPEPAFDRITRLLARVLDVPIALVSLVDEQRQWFKSRVGLDVSETPREYALCAHTILKASPLVVSDATQDPRFCDNPLVTGEPNIRFYAGVPIRSSAGLALGTLCDIVGYREDELNLRALTELLPQAIARADRSKQPFALLFVDLDGFKAVNDDFGHESDDMVLCAVADRLRACLRKVDSAVRLSGGEFVVVVEGVNGLGDGQRVATKLLESIAEPIALHRVSVSVGASAGIALYQPGTGM